jgi:O-acetyl-ADP-ribose deacetylase (regulator of RNase III)
MSSANSLGFMDGCIDLALSRIVMPGIEPTLKKAIKNYGKLSRIDRMYLPIGSSIIIGYDSSIY